MNKPVLAVRNLELSFYQYTKGLRREELKVITDINIDLQAGEILAIVGASGSGKSLLANALLGILPRNAVMKGEIYYQGELLTDQRIAQIRGKEIALMPQSINYLDPLQKVSKQIGTNIKPRKVRRKKVTSLLARYNLDNKVGNQYPFQLSGGMARKVLLMTAIASNANVIIADEPTPGLDEESLVIALNDFRTLSRAGCGILMITHDLEAAIKIADKIAVFYAGTTLEVAQASDFDNGGVLLRHPYTRALNAARPSMGLNVIKGLEPVGKTVEDGCVFRDRCQIRTIACTEEEPIYRELRTGKVRCIHAT